LPRAAKPVEQQEPSGSRLYLSRVPMLIVIALA
jgi:hypothetical protein